MSRGNSSGGPARTRELRALLTLRALPGLNDRRRRALLDAHGSAGAALRVARRAATAPIDAPTITARVDKALRTATDLGARIVGISDDTYPARLLELTDPPTVLFLLGDATLLERPAVALVGTRRHTTYGCEATRHLAGPLARAGFAIVSGLAFGIDRCAHEAALAAGGATIGCIGSGIDVVYPGAHAPLFARMVRHGLIVSEFLPGEPALRHHFPRRNRIIAALAAGVVVVEAPAKSGALITAAHAADLGREVFAVPGPIGRESSAGTHALIRDGAALALEAADIAVALTPQLSPESRTLLDRVARRKAIRPDADRGVGSEVEAVPVADAKGRALWAALEPDPRHVDELASQAGLSHAEALAGLLDLELADRVRQLPGLRFARRPAA